MKALPQITIYGLVLIALLGTAPAQQIQTGFGHQANFAHCSQNVQDAFSWVN